jgi:hypothetical protein
MAVMGKSDLEGGCFCGAIRYRIAGRPSGSMICHCQSCRRVAAAPVAAWLSVNKRDFEIVRGTPTEFSSSPPVRRSFCATCGTQLLYAHSREPDMLDVTTCSLDDPDAFPPTHHSWLNHDLTWAKFGDGLPSFAKSRYQTSA